MSNQNSFSLTSKLFLITIALLLELTLSQIINLNFTRRKQTRKKSEIFPFSNNTTNILNSFGNQINKNNFTQIISKTPFLKANFYSYLDIEIPVDFNDKYQLIAEVGIGTSPQFSEVLLDTGSNILWIAGVDCFPCSGIKNRFNHSESITYKNTTRRYDILYGTGSTQGYLSFDNIHFGNLTVSEFKFLLSFDSGSDMFSDGILGLGNFYSGEDSFSLIDQLHAQEKISKRIFSQKLNGDEKGIIGIGDYPDEIKSNKNDSVMTYGKCDCLPYSIYKKPNIYWECQLDQIFFGNNVNKSIDIYSRINFDTGTNFVLVPQFFLKKYIIDVYLKYYFERLLCVAQPVQGFIHIICDTSLRYIDMENFNLRFGGFVMVMRPEELFENYGPFLQFKISSALEESLDMWILGAPILKKFTMVFDKDLQEIGFFGPDVKYVGDIKEKPFGFFFVAIIVLLIVLVVLLVYVLIRFYKEKNSAVADADYNGTKYTLHKGVNSNGNARNAINAGYDF